MARLEATEDESQIKIKQLWDSFIWHAGELQLKVDATMEASDHSTLMMNSLIKIFITSYWIIFISYRERDCEEESQWAEGETDGYGTSSNLLRPPHLATICNDDLKWRQSFRNPELRWNLFNKANANKCIIISTVCLHNTRNVQEHRLYFNVDVGCKVILKVVYLQWT